MMNSRWLNLLPLEHIIRRADVKQGEFVLVVGAGPLISMMDLHVCWWTCNCIGY
jgi:hypothetical protein